MLGRGNTSLGVCLCLSGAVGKVCALIAVAELPDGLRFKGVDAKISDSYAACRTGPVAVFCRVITRGAVCLRLASGEGHRPYNKAG